MNEQDKKHKNRIRMKYLTLGLFFLNIDLKAGGFIGILFSDPIRSILATLIFTNNKVFINNISLLEVTKYIKRILA